MYKLYNNECDIVKGLSDFFLNVNFSFSKPQFKIIPHILSSIINSENITTLDLSKSFIDDSLLTNSDSIQKNFGDSLITLFLMVLISLILLLNTFFITLKT